MKCKFRRESEKWVDNGVFSKKKKQIKICKLNETGWNTPIECYDNKDCPFWNKE